MQASVVYWLSANYRASGAAVAMDASPAVMMRNAMQKLAKRWKRRFDDMAQKLADRFANDAMKNADTSLATAFKDAGFTVEFKMTSQMNNALQATIAENVGIIRSIPEKYFTEVEGLVMRSVARGRDLSYLTDELQKRYGITRNRAAFIALDQNNKATSVLQIARQRSLGIVEGEWEHSGAGKEPRPGHVAAGKRKQRFRLDKGCYIDGEWIFPGQKPRCKCTHRIVIPNAFLPAR
ncbi:TPA: phage minor head protein [Klebsiella pneumoniae]|uniref:phage head morphogenesis protein n=1 Tax=Klebsiella pneumoniae TaxID=573 RepID=UPI000E2B4E04|nr:phage minor head protein [Klebsiella pneumoniae]MDX6895264.1 phage head morphogenesis protein [Klebsiella pneumoniae]SWY68904.1 phage head morphogenesis protein [Klebsiella pneumoniae]SXL99658.1 phage head morphogenesis protein [Klebsiella pneumoniae]SXM05869.1 phage head morphogenesis protein [Klebsiella pneumoniae]SXM10106.1 phage head morphogenesis protein [Klebsiella pneumoniae]